MIYEVSNYTDPRESARFHPRFFPSAALPVSSVPTVRPIDSVLFETKITTQKDEQNESRRKVDSSRIVVPVVNLTELGVIHNADEQVSLPFVVIFAHLPCFHHNAFASASHS
ncbi:hypothetical protein AB6A40_007302 [Gnathostoma spinigerum]|uniref:Uncharacterized protein n=1 Tax=Gnathostoma spinigerum TaxID=75299 RepID=A0ABD6EU72_9BILA